MEPSFETYYNGGQMARVIHIHLNAPAKVRDAVAFGASRAERKVFNGPDAESKAQALKREIERNGGVVTFFTGIKQPSLAHKTWTVEWESAKARDAAFNMHTLKIGDPVYASNGQKIDEVADISKSPLGGWLVETRAGYELRVDGGSGRNARGWTNVKPTGAKDASSVEAIEKQIAQHKRLMGAAAGNKSGKEVDPNMQRKLAFLEEELAKAKVRADDSSPFDSEVQRLKDRYIAVSSEYERAGGALRLGANHILARRKQEAFAAWKLAIRKRDSQ